MTSEKLKSTFINVIMRNNNNNNLDNIGIRLHAYNNLPTIASVEPGSLSDVCGLKVGDVLDMVDGKKVSNIPVRQVEEMIETKKGKIRLQIKRDNLPIKRPSQESKDSIGTNYSKPTSTDEQLKRGKKRSCGSFMHRLFRSRSQDHCRKGTFNRADGRSSSLIVHLSSNVLSSSQNTLKKSNRLSSCMKIFKHKRSSLEPEIDVTMTSPNNAFNQEAPSEPISEATHATASVPISLNVVNSQDSTTVPSKTIVNISPNLKILNITTADQAKPPRTASILNYSENKQLDVITVSKNSNNNKAIEISTTASTPLNIESSQKQYKTSTEYTEKQVENVSSVQKSVILNSKEVVCAGNQVFSQESKSMQIEKNKTQEVDSRSEDAITITEENVDRVVNFEKQVETQKNTSTGYLQTQSPYTQVSPPTPSALVVSNNEPLVPPRRTKNSPDREDTIINKSVTTEYKTDNGLSTNTGILSNTALLNIKDLQEVKEKDESNDTKKVVFIDSNVSANRDLKEDPSSAFKQHNKTAANTQDMIYPPNDPASIQASNRNISSDGILLNHQHIGKLTNKSKANESLVLYSINARSHEAGQNIKSPDSGVSSILSPTELYEQTELTNYIEREKPKYIYPEPRHIEDTKKDPKLVNVVNPSKELSRATQHETHHILKRPSEDLVGTFNDFKAFNNTMIRSEVDVGPCYWVEDVFTKKVQENSNQKHSNQSFTDKFGNPTVKPPSYISVVQFESTMPETDTSHQNQDNIQKDLMQQKNYVQQQNQLQQKHQYNQYKQQEEYNLQQYSHQQKQQELNQQLEYNQQQHYNQHQQQQRQPQNEYIQQHQQQQSSQQEKYNEHHFKNQKEYIQKQLHHQQLQQQEEEERQKQLLYDQPQVLLKQQQQEEERQKQLMYEQQKRQQHEQQIQQQIQQQHEQKIFLQQQQHEQKIQQQIQQQQHEQQMLLQQQNEQQLLQERLQKERLMLQKLEHQKLLLLQQNQQIDQQQFNQQQLNHQQHQQLNHQQHQQLHFQQTHNEQLNQLQNQLENTTIFVDAQPYPEVHEYTAQSNIATVQPPTTNNTHLSTSPSQPFHQTSPNDGLYEQIPARKKADLPYDDTLQQFESSSNKGFYFSSDLDSKHLADRQVREETNMQSNDMMEELKAKLHMNKSASENSFTNPLQWGDVMDGVYAERRFNNEDEQFAGYRVDDLEEMERQRLHIKEIHQARRQDFSQQEEFMNMNEHLEQPSRTNFTKYRGKARVIHNFRARKPVELSLRKGDVVFLLRKVDRNWVEGEHHNMKGIFPISYVEVIESLEEVEAMARLREGSATVLYDFHPRSPLELPLKQGYIVTLIRKIDDNWYEGRFGKRRGIFPTSYVMPIREPNTPLPTPCMSPVNTPNPGWRSPSIASMFSMDFPSACPSELNFSRVSTPTGGSILEGYTPGTQSHSTTPRKLGTYHIPVKYCGNPRYYSGHPSKQSFYNTALIEEEDGNFSSEKNYMHYENTARMTSLHHRPNDFYEHHRRQSNPPFRNIKVATLERPHHSAERYSNQMLGGSVKGSQKFQGRNVEQEVDTIVKPIVYPRYKVLHEFKSRNPEELNLRKDEMVRVVERCRDGWYIGFLEVSKEFGLFPGNFVELIK